jgi:histidinol dehydrogenase
VSAIRRLSSADPDFERRLGDLRACEAAQDEGVERAVAEILAAVRRDGDAAVLDSTRRFDGLEAASMAELELPKAELQAALDGLAPEQREALAQAAQRVRAYHERQLMRSWEYTEPGRS